MIEPNKLYPKQMNGPVISATGSAVNTEFYDAEAIENYLHGLSIDTARETELENIGRIIGYLRPLVPEGFNAENILLLGTLPIQSDEEVGLATVNTNIGGQLSSAIVSETNFMGLGTYRKFLKAMAVLKRYGVTLKSVDYIAATVSHNYDIEFEEDTQDIVIYFHDNIGFKNIWILTQLFYRIATEPQVLIMADEGE
jgi:hypothetical protein